MILKLLQINTLILSNTKYFRCRFQRKTTFALTFIFLSLTLHSPTLTASGIQSLIANFFGTRQSNQDLLEGRLYKRPETPAEAVLTYLQLNNSFTSEHENLFLRYFEYQQNKTPVQSSWQNNRSLQNRWQTELASAGTEQPDFNIIKRVSQPIQVNQSSNFRVFSFENCLADAFDTAIATLQNRRDMYGENSVEFRRWIDAQIQVFEHCPESEFNPPAPPGSNWQPLEIFDRQYQIAATYFYDMQYLEAARLFEEIAEQEQSPWSSISRYLVGRSLMQEDRYNNTQTTELTRQAEAVFTELYNDAQFREQYPWIESKLSFAELTESQNSFLRTRADKILMSPEAVSVSELDDFFESLKLRRGKAAAPWGDSDFEVWLSLVLGVGNWSRNEALQRYKDTHELLWMYLVLEFDQLNYEPEVISSLIADFEELPESQFGYAAIALNTSELLWNLGRQEDTRALLYPLLEHPAAASSIPFTNIIKDKLIRLSSSQSEVIDLAMMNYESLYFFPDSFSSPLGSEWWIDPEIRNATFMSARTTSLINNLFTPDMLLQMIDQIGNEAHVSRRIAVAGWLRALFLEDREALLQFSTLLQDYYPRLETDLEKVKSDGNTVFDAAWIIINNPGMHPGIRPELGRVQTGYNETGRWVIPARLHVGLSQTRQNWWCNINTTDAGLDNRRQLISDTPWLAQLPNEQQELMARMLEKYPQGSSVNYLGNIIMDYARNNLNQDERIPQALHRLVFATRYACEHNGHGDISRAAYSLLHENFSNSEWAEKTPYWYD